MNKIWPILVSVALLSGCSFNAEPKASAAAQAFAEAFCNWDSKYLAEHTTGRAHAPEDVIESVKGQLFTSCKNVEYVGSLKVEGDDLTREAFTFLVTDDQGTRQIVFVFDFISQSDKTPMVYHFDYAD